MTEKQLAILLGYILNDIKDVRNTILDDLGKHKKIDLNQFGTSINKGLYGLIKNLEAQIDTLLEQDTIAVPFTDGPFDGLEKLLEDHLLESFGAFLSRELSQEQNKDD